MRYAADIAGPSVLSLLWVYHYFKITSVCFFFKVTAGVALFQASKTLSPSQHVSREALLLPGIWACGLATVILVSFYLTFKVIKKPHCHNSNF